MPKRSTKKRPAKKRPAKKTSERSFLTTKEEAELRERAVDAEADSMAFKAIISKRNIEIDHLTGQVENFKNDKAKQEEANDKQKREIRDLKQQVLDLEERTEHKARLLDNTKVVIEYELFRRFDHNARGGGFWQDDKWRETEGAVEEDHRALIKIYQMLAGI